MILIGSKDDWTPADRCVELNKWVSNPEMLELVVYDGAYHDFDRPKGNRTTGHIYMWMEKTLELWVFLRKYNWIEGYTEKYLEISKNGINTVKSSKFCSIHGVMLF